MAAKELKINFVVDRSTRPPRSFGAHPMALRWALVSARLTGNRYRVWKGTAGRWLVTVVRP